MSDYIIINGELYHHGVKGMRWGVRRYQNKDGSLTPAGKKKQAMYNAKDAKYDAKVNKKIQNAAWDTVVKNTKYRLNKSEERAWDRQLDKTAKAAAQSDKQYKQAKKDYRQTKKDFKEQKNIDRFKKHGLDYNIDTAVNVKNYGWKAAKRIEDRVGSKQMSRLKAETIEMGKASAKAAALTIGTIAVIGLASTAANPKMQVLDASGKVLRNIYR